MDCVSSAARRMVSLWWPVLNGQDIQVSLWSVELGLALRSREQSAFRLKQRDIVSDRLASSTARDVVVSTDYHNIEHPRRWLICADTLWQLYLRIPDYIVDDKSYVSIYETESALQSSLATSSFSEFDVSASG